MPSTLPAPIDKLAIVVVTYKRQELLANLFDSMTELTATPWRIVIVDNENSRETEAMCTAFNERLANLWGIDTEQPDAGRHRPCHLRPAAQKRRRCGRLLRRH